MTNSIGNEIRPPFPYFGGKRLVADEVWKAFGDVDHYVEPFAGSLAVLLGRPTKPKLETVNDREAFLCNFFRAAQAAPEEVAKWADRPINETDLFATHLWLVNEGKERIAKLEADPFYFDAKVAGLWVWGICSWVGAAWCSGKGPWSLVDGRVIDRREEDRKDGVPGVRRKIPNIVTPGVGINRPTEKVLDYMLALSQRLRYTRVCCGDWTRIVTTGALFRGAVCGVFLDPPYGDEDRYDNLYTHDSYEISTAVRQWAIEHGDDPRLRIALCGYEGEHEMPASWRKFAYSANRAYGHSESVKESGNVENRHRERIWFSPYCLKQSDEELFDLLT